MQVVRYNWRTVLATAKETPEEPDETKEEEDTENGRYDRDDNVGTVAPEEHGFEGRHCKASETAACCFTFGVVSIDLAAR